MNKSALVLVSDGSEEMETVITTDVLRRAEINVVLAAIGSSLEVKCSRNVVLKADILLSDLSDSALKDFDLIALPGGIGGAKSMADSNSIHLLLQNQFKSAKLIGAICAAPIVLKAANVGKGKIITSHPSVKPDLISDFDYVEGEKVVVDGNLITSRGPGTTFDFALKLVELLQGPQIRAKISAPMMV